MSDVYYPFRFHAIPNHPILSFLHNVSDGDLMHLPSSSYISAFFRFLLVLVLLNAGESHDDGS